MACPGRQRLRLRRHHHWQRTELPHHRCRPADDPAGARPKTLRLPHRKPPIPARTPSCAAWLPGHRPLARWAPSQPAGTLIFFGLLFLEARTIVFGSGVTIMLLCDGAFPNTTGSTRLQLFDAVAMGPITPGRVVITAAFGTVSVFTPIYPGVVCPAPLVPPVSGQPSVAVLGHRGDRGGKRRLVQSSGRPDPTGQAVIDIGCAHPLPPAVGRLHGAVRLSTGPTLALK